MDPNPTVEEAALEVTLAPDPEHCIEAVARREHRRCVAACLRSPVARAELAARLEVLRRFLECADFWRLRRESGPLVRAGRPVRFVVRLEPSGPSWRMETAGDEPARR